MKIKKPCSSGRRSPQLTTYVGAAKSTVTVADAETSATARLPTNTAGRAPVWLSSREAAARAGCSVRTLKRWIKAGYLHAGRGPSPKGMGPLKIRAGDLESVIASGAIN